MAWWKQWVLSTFGTFGSQGHESTPGYPRALCDTFKAQGPEEFLGTFRYQSTGFVWREDLHQLKENK